MSTMLANRHGATTAPRETDEERRERERWERNRALGVTEPPRLKIIFDPEAPSVAEHAREAVAMQIKMERGNFYQPMIAGRDEAMELKYCHHDQAPFWARIDHRDYLCPTCRVDKDIVALYN